MGWLVAARRDLPTDEFQTELSPEQESSRGVELLLQRREELLLRFTPTLRDQCVLGVAMHGKVRARYLPLIRPIAERPADRRTRVGKALTEWADALACDLGGVDALSTAQKALIEQAATMRLLLDSIDA